MGNKDKLAKCIEELGLQLDTLRDRKIFQKKIYFLQQFGFNLGYGYGFYIYGPYSSELTKDAFSLKSQSEVAPKTIETEELSELEKESIIKINEFIEYTIAVGKKPGLKLSFPQITTI